jgi:hypothetical protein
MIVTDSFMMRKMARALREGGDLYNLNDIQKMLSAGTAQGHVVGETWAITQVHQFPAVKSVNIMVVVGNMEDSLKLEKKIEEWAKGLGATLLTGIGRDGWWEYKTPGWKKLGTMYAKDIS